MKIIDDKEKSIVNENDGLYNRVEEHSFNEEKQIYNPQSLLGQR